MRDNDSGCCAFVIRRQCRTTVKAKPAHPQQASTCNGQRRAVRQHQCFGKADALAEHQGHNQRGYASGCMDHNAARKIDSALLHQKAIAPDPAGYRHINQQRPKRAKSNNPAKTGPLHPCADNQGWGDNGKGHLEQTKDELANALPVTHREHICKQGILHIADIDTIGSRER